MAISRSGGDAVSDSAKATGGGKGGDEASVKLGISSFFHFKLETDNMWTGRNGFPGLLS